MWSGLSILALMLMLVSGRRLGWLQCAVELMMVLGVIQDAKFKRREALADLAKAVGKK